MQLLTSTGYKNIEDCSIGEQLIAYDIVDGHVIINQLESKQWMSADMFQDEYDDDGNLYKTKEQIYIDTYGDVPFYRINNTWTLYGNQSIWANMNVTHVKELQVGDIVYNGLDGDVVITSIEVVSGIGWWRLTVSGDHSYIADNLTLHNASRYWVGGGSSANWSATGNTNWSSTSGGANNASVPTSVDDVTFNGAGANGNTASTISATITILSLTITSGYTNTLTHNANLTVAGNVTLSTAYTIAGTATLIVSTTSTITSGGKTWPNNLTISSALTTTISGNLSVTGLLTISGRNAVINAAASETITVAGGLTVTNALSSAITGTIKIQLTGGTWTSNISSNTLNISQLSLAGNITLASIASFGTGTLVYTSGTITTTGSTLYLCNSTSLATLNTNGITWNNVTFVPGNTTTITLTSDLNINGLLSTTLFGVTINKTASEKITVAGGITISTQLTGTADIYLTGGTWSGSASIALGNNLYINGNVTVSGGVRYGTGTMTYQSGTVTTTGSTLTLNTSTLNTNGITWNNITNATTTVITLTSDLTLAGNLSTTAGNPFTINKTASEKVTIAGGLTVTAIITSTADIYLTGGTWSAGAYLSSNLYINGNVTVSGTVYFANTGTSYTLTYLSGIVTTGGTTLNINQGGITLNTNGIFWDTINIPAGGGLSITLTSDLYCNRFIPAKTGVMSVNKTTNESVYIYQLLSLNSASSGGGVTGSADIYLKGGTWTTSNGSTVGNNLYLDGNIIITGTVQKSVSGKELTWLSGKIDGLTATLNITTNQTVKGFNRIPLKAVVINATAVITMDEFFTGTASQICQVSCTSTTLTYTITFNDNFEKIAKFVAVSNCTLTRRMQLLLLTNSLFNTNRGTNAGIRYINQFPNGFSKNEAFIGSTRQYGPALGYVGDPNFVMQG
jgi:cytoskeletal protein CcmA (bactofilin family)